MRGKEEVDVHFGRDFSTARNLQRAFRCEASVPRMRVVKVVLAEIDGSFARGLGEKIVPSKDSRAQPQFAICHRSFGASKQSAKRLVGHIVDREMRGPNAQSPSRLSQAIIPRAWLCVVSNRRRSSLVTARLMGHGFGHVLGNRRPVIRADRA